MAGWHTILKSPPPDTSGEGPIVIEIGPEIAIHLTRVGATSVHVSVVAPRDLKITRRAGESSRVAE